MKVLQHLFALIYFVLQVNVYGQNESHNSIKALNDEISTDSLNEAFINRFDRWAYSEKKHDAFAYLAPIIQYGTGTPEDAYNVHHDAGLMYRWFMVDKKDVKLNLQGWIEQTSFWAGETTSDFSKKTGMISSPNASSETGHDLSLESFFFEAFFFDKKWDITLGKFDPLFLTTFTNYSGWDKYNYFSKSAASDPVPDLDGGIGFYTEYHFSKDLSLGGLVVDNEARNNFLYIPDFGNTTWNYMGFARFKIGRAKGLYSDHNLIFYHQTATGEKESGSGFIYTGNQGLSKKLILVLKASKGEGRIDKLNAAYVAGLTFIKPANRTADQAGFAMIVNEKGSDYEYGIDTYWKFGINAYLNISPNVQAYYTQSDQINTIFGARVFLAY